MTEKKVYCRCNNHVPEKEMKSYVHKRTEYRVTVCDECAKSMGLNNPEVYTCVPFTQIPNNLTVTPKMNPHAAGA